MRKTISVNDFHSSAYVWPEGASMPLGFIFLSTSGRVFHLKHSHHELVLDPKTGSRGYRPPMSPAVTALVRAALITAALRDGLFPFKEKT